MLEGKSWILWGKSSVLKIFNLFLYFIMETIKWKDTNSKGKVKTVLKRNYYFTVIQTNDICFDLMQVCQCKLA